MVSSQVTYNYLVSIGNNINSHASCVLPCTILLTLLLMTSKADKLPLEKEPLFRDYNTIFKLKLDDKTFVVPFSSDNRSVFVIHLD